MQKDIFLNSEANAWYERNKNSGIGSCDIDIIKKYIPQNDARILEIGCASGAKLEQFRFNNVAYGIDPSTEAIEEGKKVFPYLNLSVGTADNLPYDSNFFNVVIFGFCLYLVDRDLLFRCVSEADRVLKRNGYLIITDFDSEIPFKRNYHHKENIYTYKMNYSKLFIASPDYCLVEKKSFSHSSDSFALDPQERIATTILVKDSTNAYYAS
jgi:ubiquinone/menaquinone biosynthesis C-methylase UbiE